MQGVAILRTGGSTRRTWRSIDPFSPPQVVNMNIIDTERCPTCGEEYDRLSPDNLRWIGSNVSSISDPVRVGFSSLFPNDDIGQMFKPSNVEGIARLKKKEKYVMLFRLNGIRAKVEFQKVDNLFVALNLRRIYIT